MKHKLTRIAIGVPTAFIAQSAAVVMLKQGVSWIEGLYFGLGVAISGLYIG